MTGDWSRRITIGGVLSAGVLVLVGGCGSDSSGGSPADSGSGGATGEGGSSVKGGTNAGGSASGGSSGTSPTGGAGRGSGGLGGSDSGGKASGGGSTGGTGKAQGGSVGDGGEASGTGGDGGDGGDPGLGLRVVDNRLIAPDGEPFHGRGANLHDTRSCNACTHLPPDVDGLNRWSDELLDGWGANFVRFDLEAYSGDDGYRQQWRTLTQDSDYLADIKTSVTHMTRKSGVYVLVTLFADPTIKEDNSDYDSEWPTAQTIPVYEALADALADDPKVLFGLTNEPHGPEDRNAELAQRYLMAIDAIRAVEEDRGVPEHVVVVQAPQSWSRYLDWFVENPIDRSNVAYEVHPYNPEGDFDELLTQPSQTLPVIVGEYGPSQYSTMDDVRALWDLCQQLEIPHIAWNFHHRCPPNLLQDVTISDGCGLDPDAGYAFPRTSDWGDPFFDYLQTPW